jgi:hypothetical protein
MIDETSKEAGESLGETRPTTSETPYAVEPVPEVYPLRDRAEDPRWALWVIGIWLTISIGLFLFFLVLLVLGFWYD